jgi:hypothetical protein
MDATQDPNYGAIIQYSKVVSQAEIQLMRMEGNKIAPPEPLNTQGKVMSPMIKVDVTQYPILHLRIAGLEGDLQWKVGIQTSYSKLSYYGLNKYTQEIGEFSFNYASQSRLAGLQGIAIVLTAQSGLYRRLQVDWIRLESENGMHEIGIEYMRANQPTCLSPTSTSIPWQENRAPEIQIYPNPARGKIHFAYPIQSAGSHLEISIFNLNGERITQLNSGGAPRVDWNAVNVAPGIYFCTIDVINNSGTRLTSVKKKIALLQP